MRTDKISGQIKSHQYGLPILSNKQVEQADAAQVFEPGIIVVVRNASQWSMAEYIQLDNSGCSQGEVLVTNHATLAQFSVRQGATADDGAPIRGISCATIASQKFGWMYIWGYVEKADCSKTVASGEYLKSSGSTAGKLTPFKASVFNAGTFGSSSAFVVFGVGRSAFATGVGSISILGMWG